MKSKRGGHSGRPHGHWKRRAPPDTALRRIDNVLSRVPRLRYLGEVRSATHAASGLAFALTISGDQIVAIQPQTDAGRALLHAKDEIQWARTEGWWLEPPTIEEERRQA